MKLYSTFNKLPLVTFLYLGLSCSPLLASTADDDIRHGDYQQNHDKHHYWAEHRRDHRDYQENRRYEKRGGYNKRKKSHPAKTGNSYHGHGYTGQSYRIRRHHNIVIVRPYGQWCL